MARSGLSGFVALSALALGLMLPAAALAVAPTLLPVQGHLTDKAGTPMEGTVEVRFRLYSASNPQAADAKVLHEETQQVRVDAGDFTVYLGDSTRAPLDLSIFRQQDNVWLGVKLASDPDEMQPLVQLATVPYAAFSTMCGDAATLGGAPASSFLSKDYAPAWSAIKDKPATFPVAPHRHSASEIDGLGGGSAPANRTEHIGLPGLAFAAHGIAAKLVQHTTTGRLFLNSDLATAQDVAYATAPFTVPFGARLTQVVCSIDREATAGPSQAGIVRSNGDGSPVIDLGLKQVTGAGVRDVVLPLDETYATPRHGYYVAVNLTRGVTLNGCTITYLRP